MKFWEKQKCSFVETRRRTEANSNLSDHDEVCLVTDRSRDNSSLIPSTFCWYRGAAMADRIWQLRRCVQPVEDTAAAISRLCSRRSIDRVVVASNLNMRNYSRIWSKF